MAQGTGFITEKTSRANGIEPATSDMQFDRPSASRHLRHGRGPTGEQYYYVLLCSPASSTNACPGLCRSVFSRPVCPYAIVTFDPVTRDVTILPGAVPAGAARPAHSLGEGDDRGGEGQPRTHLMVGRTFSASRFKEWTEWEAPISWSATQTGAT